MPKFAFPVPKESKMKQYSVFVVMALLAAFSMLHPLALHW
jgi:hypothetical protein